MSLPWLRYTLFGCLLVAIAAFLLQNPLAGIDIREEARARLIHYLDNTSSALKSTRHIPAIPLQSTDRWSHDAVAGAFKYYTELADIEVNKMQRAYDSLGDRYHTVGNSLGYQSKLNVLRDAEMFNGETSSAIGDMAILEYNINSTQVASNKQGSLFRVREALLHYMRDWSDEGAEERAKIFGPILSMLSNTPQDERAKQNVLLPGSGLGRLAWDISELGYHTTACEYSYYMVMALRYLLNPFKTNRPLQHTIQPWAHRFSHQRRTEAMFRFVPFPDVVPRLSKRFHLIEGDFFNVEAPLRDDGSKGFDYIVTLFFIDTSSNVAKTLEHVHSLLVPGGVWINLGPLLWTAAGTAGFELSLEEVLKLAKETGFAVDDGAVDEARKQRTIECEYTGDMYGMFKRLYQAEYWVATKVD